jgi:hypothetical protein
VKQVQSSSQRSARDRYVKKVWITQLALPIVVFTVVLGILDFGITAREIFSWKFLGVVAITAAASILFAVWLGRRAYKNPLLRPPDDQDGKEGGSEEWEVGKAEMSRGMAGWAGGKRLTIPGRCSALRPE